MIEVGNEIGIEIGIEVEIEMEYVCGERDMLGIGEVGLADDVIYEKDM